MMDAKSISLKHWLKYIESIHPKQIEFGLDRIRSVAEKETLNQLDCPVVLVGGTNGKGSTVALLAKLLQAMGLRVGAYFSPHLIYFTERIVVNGNTCPEAKLCWAFAKIEKLRGKTPLTFFEFTTLAAFHIFKEEKLDIILLEVGCGGEKDAVNIVDPNLSIITSIGLDHTEWLGQTLEDIGLAKAGILRSHKPAILGAEAQIPAILQKAHHLQSKLILEGPDFGWNDIYKSYWHFQSRFIQIPPHLMPSTSVSLALAALENLWSTFFSHKTLPYEHIGYYLRTAQMPGRFQRVYTKRETIFDVAHNESGAIWLADKFKKLYPQVTTIGVWSSLADKDLEKIAQPFTEIIDTWIIAPIQSSRAASMDHLEKTLVQLNVSRILKETSLHLAYERATNIANKNDHILVFGSCYTVGEVLKSIEMDFRYANTFYVESTSNLTKKIAYEA